MDKKKLLVICGPTGIGKTSLALSLAKRFDSELVSSDSRQVYTGMDIVTGKGLFSKEKIEKLRFSVTHADKLYSLAPYMFHGVPLWMCDVVSPNEDFSVSHYQSLAGAVVEDIQKNNKLPIVVGGTGLYIRSIIHPLETASIGPDLNLRKDLSTLSFEELQTKLRHVDSDTFENLNESDRKNPRRIIRKIEICLSEKKILNDDVKNNSDVLMIGLTSLLPKLYERIDRRVEDRLLSGALEEIRSMQSKYGFDIPSMTGLGYREWRAYFSKNHDQSVYDRCVLLWKLDEHAYARRQMTWFRKEKNIHWFDIEDSLFEKDIESLVNIWYSRK